MVEFKIVALEVCVQFTLSTLIKNCSLEKISVQWKIKNSESPYRAGICMAVLFGITITEYNL